jgi:hypothetical protein
MINHKTVAHYFIKHLYRAMTLKSLAEKFLSERPHKIDETVQFGWFVFKIAESGLTPRIQSLDFRQIASFTEDFTEAERIHSLQTATLRRIAAPESPCTLQQFALVSASYSPERTDVFIERQQSAKGNDSGWYMGIYDDARDLENSASFVHRSLYELTIYDMRTAPFWLLPPGSIIRLSTQEIQFKQT